MNGSADIELSRNPAGPAASERDGDATDTELPPNTTAAAAEFVDRRRDATDEDDSCDAGASFRGGAAAGSGWDCDASS